jgi:hypothetical protein
MENNTKKPLKVVGSRTLYATDNEANLAAAEMIAKALLKAKHEQEVAANYNQSLDLAVDSMQEIIDEIDKQSEGLPVMASNATLDEQIKSGYFKDLFAPKAVQEKAVSDSADEPQYRSGTGFSIFANK